MSKNNYKPLGDYIEQVNIRNRELLDVPLLGVSVQKIFIPSIANTVGTDFSKYKVLEKNQFTYIADTSRRGDKIGVAHLKDYDKALVSQAYTTFKITNEEKLNPDYLMMWFVRPEFDRYARYHSYGSVREVFDWDAMCNVMLPVPSIEEQQKIVAQYQAVENKIKTNEQICEKLEETAQAIYKEWFVDFNFPNEDGKPYKDNGGKMVWNDELEKEVPEGWEVGSIGSYSSVKSGFAFKSKWWQTSGIPVIKIGSINNNSIDINLLDYVHCNKIELAKKYQAQKSDIVIAMTGATIGKVGLIPDLESIILVNQRVGIFDLGSEPINKAAYLYLTLLSSYVQNEIQSVGGNSAQANISSSQIEDIQLIIPNGLIVSKFNKIGKVLLRKILSNIKQNQKLSEFKEFLLTRMVK